MNEEQNNFKQILDFFEDKSLKEILQKYQKTKEKMEERRFNVFTLSSDKYYRENFHSDFFKAFLDPNEAHQEGTLYLDAFIEMLNKYFLGKVNIDKDDYKDATAEREPDRIDILIKSESSKHCMIIENKSNNADDTDNQIPKYWCKMKSNKYIVDAIVYIPLDECKSPDKSTWIFENTDDRKEVEKLLCIVPIYSLDANKANMVRDWVLPCSTLSERVNNFCILNQLAELLKMLNNDTMNKETLNAFRKILLMDDNYKTLSSLLEMYNDLPRFMASNIAKKYNDNLEICPFKVDTRNSSDIYKIIRCIKGEDEYKIDVSVEPNQKALYNYKIAFYKQDRYKHYIDWCDGFDSVDGFVREESKDGPAIIKTFAFNEESEVIKCVQAIIKETSEYLSQQDNKQNA